MEADERLRDRLLRRFGKPDTLRTQAAVERELDAVWERYARRGYVDYSDLYLFGCDVGAVLEEAAGPLMRPDSLDEAFAATTAFLLAVQDFSVDESDGFSGDNIDDCIRYWHDIVSLSAISPDGPAVRGRVFSWVRSFVAENPGNDYADVYWLQRDEAISFLEKEAAANPELACEILAGLDASEELDEIGEAFFAESDASWLARRVAIMEQAGASWEERLSFAGPFLRFREVRLVFVESARAAGELGEALRLLLEGRELAPEHSRRIAFGEQLVEVYRAMGEGELARAEMVALAECDPGFSGEGTRWFEELKAETPAGEWPEVCKRLVGNMESSFSRRSCLALEGLYDELMDDLETRHDNSYRGPISDARRFRGELGARFPGRVLKIYADEVKRRLAPTTKRSVYREAVSLLPEMVEIEGDAAEASKLAAIIRAEYPRRSALQDELRRAGW